MPFVSTDDVLEAIREVLDEHFDLRRMELENGPERVPRVLKWVANDWVWPENADAGDFPKGFVNFDPERTSERREQDSGETATIGYVVEVYFTRKGMTAAAANQMAVRYGDGVLWTLMREAKLVLPRNAVAQPGLFRGWPETMRVGEVRDTDLYGCEVRGKVIVDSSFEGSVTP